MFKKELETRFKKIFGFEKTTFNAPSDSFEQDVLFIQIENPHVKLTQARALAKVYGQVVVYSQDDKLTYGYFNKRIEKADYALTKDLFFYDIDVNLENSPARLQNINERRASFVFFFSTQYDPKLGELTTLETEIEEV